MLLEIGEIQDELAVLPSEPISFITQAREEQLSPGEGGPWTGTWYVRGSRGSGKSWTGAGQLAKEITENAPLPDGDPSEYGIVAPTIADVRDVCFEGGSGLIKALGGVASRGTLYTKGPHITGYNRSMSQLYLKNGGTVFGASADDGALRVQGKNLRVVWCDEIGLWIRWDTAWNESIRYALRKSPAKIIATGTPKMNQKSRVLVKQLLTDPKVAKSFLSLDSNIDHLDAKRVEELQALRGTRLGRQEVGGELVEDIEGAYFFQTQIDDDRIYDGRAHMPRRGVVQWLMGLIGTEIVRMVVAIDPAVTDTEDSDETGMIVACLGANGHGYVIEDLSGRYSPEEWARLAVDAYKKWQADVIVAETNNGGDMVGLTIHTVDADVPYRKITATRGKILRAEPISSAYAQHRVHHVGSPENYEMLEAQLTDCIPGQDQEHDDRLDACVYALTELGLAGGGMTWEEVYGGEAPSGGGQEGAKVKTPTTEGGTEDDEEAEEEYDPWAAAYR